MKVVGCDIENGLLTFYCNDGSKFSCECIKEIYARMISEAFRSYKAFWRPIQTAPKDGSVIFISPCSPMSSPVSWVTSEDQQFPAGVVGWLPMPEFRNAN